MDSLTRNERLPPGPPPPPPEAFLDPLPTPERTPPMELTRDEERLVALTCSLAKAQALELLALAAPSRAPGLVQAARTFVQLPREARLASMNRLLAPAPCTDAIRRLAERLEVEPAWFAALVCRGVAPPVRDRLLASPRTRAAWRTPLVPNPALESQARRFAARYLTSP